MIVVGGGVVGLAAARELARRGARVSVVDGKLPGAEASWAAGGMLAPQAEADRDDDFFRFQCASRDMYPEFADALVGETGLDPELERTGTLYVALSDEDAGELEARRRWQQKAGLAVEPLTGAEARRLEPALAPDVRLALRFPRDWQVENRRLLDALARAARDAYGVQMLSETWVKGVRIGARGAAEGVETSRGFLAASAVVVAAGAWTSRIELLAREGGPASSAPFHVVPVRGQMLCFRQDLSFLPFARHVVYSRRGYIVPRRDGRLLAGSTTEEVGFDKSVTGDGLSTIITHALEIAPGVGRLRLADTWAGLRPRAGDGLPVIGESAEVSRLFYATGHYRNGILLAPLTAELVAGMVLGGDARRDAPFRIESFSPARFHASQANIRQAHGVL